MHEKLIPTPWDLFCAGHIELPDGNILLAGGTARYENLKPDPRRRRMTVVNTDTAQAWTLPKGTIFTAPDGAQFATAFAMTIPRATTRQGGAGGLPTVIAQPAEHLGRRGQEGQGLADREGRAVQRPGPASGRRPTSLLYGIGTPMTLQKQNFLGTKDAYIFNVKTAAVRQGQLDELRPLVPDAGRDGQRHGHGHVRARHAGQITMNSEMFNPEDQHLDRRARPAASRPTRPRS